MKGFTLIELIIGITMTAFLMLAGSMLFYRGLGLGGETQSNVNTTSSTTNLLNGMARFLKYQLVEEIAGESVQHNRLACENAYPSPVSGSILRVSDNYGNSELTLTDSQVTSESGSLVVITPSSLVVRNLSFDWYCQPGSSDRVVINLEARDVSQTSDLRFAPFVKEVYLYNSGLK